MYINRAIDAELLAWARSRKRKPLLLRGARQVGKTTAVRHMAEVAQLNLVEIDLSRRTDLHVVFDQPEKTPQEIARELSALLNRDIVAGNSLLFLDEIQACPAAIELLRYFYEQYPELHVLASGSLLEFALRKIANFGVGRIHSLFMYPLSFSEFLVAQHEEKLLEALCEATPRNPLTEALFAKACEQFRLFYLIGGLPEVVETYVETKNLSACETILSDLVLTYEDDFTKYRSRSSSLMLSEVFRSVAFQGEGKFVYRNVNPDVRVEQVKTALETLLLSGLLIPVTRSSGDGVPLEAQANPKFRKIYYFDTGLLLRMLRIPLSEHSLETLQNLVNKGAGAENFVAAELVKSASNQSRTALFYWANESKNGNAELDFLIELHGKVYPVEVKSGRKGSMKSLWVYLEKKKEMDQVSPKAIRLSLENFGRYDRVDVIPLFAAGLLGSMKSI